MKTIKVIDLLNKIANNDLDTPDYIEFFDRETSKSNKMMVCEENIIYYMNRNALFLNDEVEIIDDEEPQEHKIPEKLDTWFSMENIQNNGMSKEDFIIKYANYNFETYFNKINEILDYLEVNND